MVIMEETLEIVRTRVPRVDVVQEYLDSYYFYIDNVEFPRVKIQVSLWKRKLERC